MKEDIIVWFAFLFTAVVTSLVYRSKKLREQNKRCLEALKAINTWKQARIGTQSQSEVWTDRQLLSQLRDLRAKIKQLSDLNEKAGFSELKEVALEVQNCHLDMKKMAADDHEMVLILNIVSTFMR